MIKDEPKDYDYDYAQYRGWYDKFRATQPPTTNQVVLMKALMERVLVWNTTAIAIISKTIA